MPEATTDPKTSLVDSKNQIFSLAFEVARDTACDIFLTGKAGTGKTTFLKFLQQNIDKNTAVIAPTGVAAINAGGVTIHSFFRLPLEAFVPDALGNLRGATSGKPLREHFRTMGKAKIDVLKRLELLVIDEISMVRADLLDAIDEALRFARRNPAPFGGVQMIYIGDLFQLSPVVRNDDWAQLKEFYESPFFFDSQSIKRKQPIPIELKKIYRQSDREFIDLLNHIRDNNMSSEDFARLDRCFHPEFKPAKNERFITLSTHNSKVDAINRHELAALPGKMHQFQSEIDGEFPESAYPLEKILQLKVGAQVMFVRNDSSEERRFYNGKLATVTRIEQASIFVKFEDSSEEFLLEKIEWQNLRYVADKESDMIKSEVQGTFRQFPIRLAWAITIHKSQGLTFERAIVDAESAFSPGQVYVALSRCVSMKGLVLKTRILPRSIQTEARVENYAELKSDESNLAEILKTERANFLLARLKSSFSFHSLLIETKSFINSEQADDIWTAGKKQELTQRWNEKSVELQKISQSFQAQLIRIFQENEEQARLDALKDRCGKAIVYFSQFLTDEFKKPLAEYKRILTSNNLPKDALKRSKSLEDEIDSCLVRLEKTQYRGNFLGPKSHQPMPARDSKSAKPKEKRPAVGTTYIVSYQLYRTGKSISEIAAERGLTIQTVEGHLARFIESGELNINELVEKSTLETILNFLKSFPVSNEKELGVLSAIKSKLGEGISFGQIRLAIAYKNHLSRSG